MGGYCQVNEVIRLFLRHTSRMRTAVSLYHRHRFPAEIISHCVWLYFRFTDPVDFSFHLLRLPLKKSDHSFMIAPAGQLGC
jgi:hypothetical protein